MIDWLKGKKSYIIAALIGIATGLRVANVIDQKAYEIIMAVLAPGQIMAIRAAIDKTATK
jgi:hypothetical protein